MVKVVDIYDLDDGESTDSSIDLDQTQNQSLAASAAYIPGVSLSDKLRLAASKGQVDKVQQLIHAGATFEPDREGRTALHYAALNGHGEIIQILSDEGADINSQDTLGYTALHRAAAQGHLEVIKVLVCEGCLVNRQDEVHGNSPLHEASWNGYSRTLELLIRHKANVLCVNKAGFTALHLAAQNGHNQSARVLLYAGSPPDMKNNYGDTALHTAARYGHAGVARILVSARCHISEQNKNGDTALHISSALKRRKLAKLLTECGIDVSLKNKQNETAADVARRKDHTDIIQIIAAQPKPSKKSKKGKDKKSKDEGDGTEKKGGFFSRKKKKKDKKSEKVTAAVVEPPPRAADHYPRAPSEASSSDYNPKMAPDDIRGFHHDMPAPPIASARGTSTRGGSRPSKKGLLSDYAPKQGVQYYKDLAGNVKKGPIGFAPVCNCQPVIKKLEKKMEHDRNNIYDHIDTFQRKISHRMDDLDMRSSQHVLSVDALTRERLEEERRNREDYVQSCLRKERMEVQEACDQKHHKMRTDLQGHLDNRFTNFERYYSTVSVNRREEESCYTCHAAETYGQPRYHQDDLLNPRCMTYGTEQPPPPGKLYKSKSDETLSVVSSHHSRKHWKMQSQHAKASAEREIRDMKLAQVMDQARRMERKIRSRSTGVKAKESSTEHLNKPRQASMPSRQARMPDGRSGSDLHSEYQSYKDYVQQQHVWNAKRAPVNVEASRQHFNNDPSHDYETPQYASAGARVSHQHDQHREQQQQQQQHRDHQQQHSSQPQLQQPSYRRSRSASQNSDNNPPNASQRYSLHGGDQHYQGNYGNNAHAHHPSAGLPRQTSSYSQDGTMTLGRSRPQRSTDHIKPATSSYNVNGDGWRSQNHMPRSTSTYDQQPQATRASRQTAGPPPPPPRARSSSEPRKPQGLPAPQGETSTPTNPAPSARPRWMPLHTSSPETPDVSYGSPSVTPNSSAVTANSSATSTPLYPSPSYPTATAAAKTNRSESDSNADSGYGGRMFNGRQISGPQLGGDRSQNSSGYSGSPVMVPQEGETRQTADQRWYNKDSAKQWQPAPPHANSQGQGQPLIGKATQV